MEAGNVNSRPPMRGGPRSRAGGLSSAELAFGYAGQHEQQQQQYFDQEGMTSNGHVDVGGFIATGSQFSPGADYAQYVGGDGVYNDSPYHHHNHHNHPGSMFLPAASEDDLDAEGDLDLDYPSEFQSDLGFDYNRLLDPRLQTSSSHNHVASGGVGAGAPSEFHASPQWAGYEEVYDDRPSGGPSRISGGGTMGGVVNYAVAAHLQPEDEFSLQANGGGGDGIGAIGQAGGGSINPLTTLMVPSRSQASYATATTDEHTLTSAVTVGTASLASFPGGVNSMGNNYQHDNSNIVSSDNSNSNDDDDGKSCVPCDARFKSNKDRNRHFLSTKHVRRMQEMANDENGNAVGSGLEYCGPGEHGLGVSPALTGMQTFVCSCHKTQTRKDLHRRHVLKCRNIVVGSPFFCSCGRLNLYQKDHVEHIATCGRKQAGRPRKQAC